MFRALSNAPIMFTDGFRCPNVFENLQLFLSYTCTLPFLSSVVYCLSGQFWNLGGGIAVNSRYPQGSCSEPSTKPDGTHSFVPAYVGERSLSWLHTVESRVAHTVMSSCLWTFSKLLLLFITKICRVYFYPLLCLFRNKISCSQALLCNWGRLQCLILLPLVLTLQVSLCDTGYGTHDFLDAGQAFC